MRLGIAVCLVLFHLGPPPAGPDGSTEVTVVDVGQAQAVILRGPTGGFALVDAAGTAGGRFDAGERVVGPALRRLGCRRLEVLLLTHEHDDHAGGAAAILREFEVGELWIPPGAHRRPRIRQLAALGRRQGTALVLAERGHRRVRAGIELEVLHPTRNDIQLKTNDRSVVLRTGRAPARALIPGDLESTGESRLLGAGASFAAEALIVGHHGGRRSTTDPWLDGVQPRIAVVSAGAGNRFGHPDPQVLDRLARRQVRVLRTDRHGMVRLSSGPAGWRVRHYRRSESKDDRRSRDERGQEDDEQHQRQ